MEAATGKDKPSASPPDLAGMSDEEQLRTRICDLKVAIAGSELESRIASFHRELGERGIAV